MSFVLPGHRYLGPGNSVQSGTPVDVDDLIAKLHDERYEQAFTDADIVAADKEAIKSFLTDYKQTGNWHSLLGASGLKVKTLIESVFGVIYPRTRMNIGTPSSSRSGTQKRKRYSLRKKKAQKKQRLQRPSRNMLNDSKDEENTKHTLPSTQVNRVMDEIDRT